MLLRELYEAQVKNIVAVMPGGFHPFHPGHKSLYDWAVETFGKENVYVAATDDTKERPFPFDVKKKLAAMAGVPANRFIQVKSPFNALSYEGLLGDPANTALVFIRSEKDQGTHPKPDQVRKSDGNMGYLISYKGKEDLVGADTHGHMTYGPTIDFNFSGMAINSASQLRAAWPEMSPEDKMKAADLMYPGQGKTAAALLDKALGVKEAPVGETTIEESQMSFDDMMKNREFYYIYKQYVKGNANVDQVAELVRGRVDKEQFADEVFKQGVMMGGTKGSRIKDLADHIRKDSNVLDLPGKAFSKIKKMVGMGEDVSPEDEDKFHNELDDLVHKYFGDSPDEEKMKKKKGKKVSELELFKNKDSYASVKEQDPNKLKVLDWIAARTDGQEHFLSFYRKNAAWSGKLIFIKPDQAKTFIQKVEDNEDYLPQIKQALTSLQTTSRLFDRLGIKYQIRNAD
jgi:hypothetical protein